MKMTLMGCTDHLGGVTSAISTALMPSAHTSTCQAAFVLKTIIRQCFSVYCQGGCATCRLCSGNACSLQATGMRKASLALADSVNSSLLLLIGGHEIS